MRPLPHESKRRRAPIPTAPIVGPGRPLRRARLPYQQVKLPVTAAPEMSEPVKVPLVLPAPNVTD